MRTVTGRHLSISKLLRHTMKLPGTWDSMAESRFLKQSDFPEPTLVTIESFEKMNVAKENEEPEVKWVIHFSGYDKPLVLNAINRQILGTVFDSPQDAIGGEIVVYTDPSISFGGKLVGGIRLRPKKGAAKPASDDAF